MIRVLRGLRRKRGATAIEYGLLAGLLALALVGVMSTMGTSLNTFFGNLGTNVQNS